MSKIIFTGSFAGGRCCNYQVGECHFSVWAATDRHLGSFGGAEWPHEHPTIFEEYGPDTGLITYRSGWRVRDSVLLPTA